MSNRTLVNQKSLSSWLVKQPKENQNSGMLIINSTTTKDGNDHITLKCRYIYIQLLIFCKYEKTTLKL